MPEVVGKIKDLKDRLELEIEREDMERAKLAFAKMHLEGEKKPQVFLQPGKTDEKNHSLGL